MFFLSYVNVSIFLCRLHCNGSAAGLGYMEVVWIVPEKSFHRGSEHVSALSCWRIWTVWRTFRYWAVRATETWVRVPLGGEAQFLYWLKPKTQQLSSSASMFQVIFKTLNILEHPLNIHWKNLRTHLEDALNTNWTHFMQLWTPFEYPLSTHWTSYMQFWPPSNNLR